MASLNSLDKHYYNFRGILRSIAIKRKHGNKIKNQIKVFEKLSDSERSQIDKFWGKYKKITYNYHVYYSRQYGEFSPYYIPNDVWVLDVDSYFNNAKKAVVFENKTYFQDLFPSVKQPDIVCYRRNNFWYDNKKRIISTEEALDLMLNEKSIFLKQAEGSSSGDAVFYIEINDNKKEITDIINGIHKDIIVQKPVKQHKGLAQFNPSSVNTLRVVSLLRKDGTVKICSIVLRIGVGGAKVYNAGQGGIFLGVDENGNFRKYSHHKYSGEKYTQHPTTGVVFEGNSLPSYNELTEKIKSLHKLIPEFRLVSWDFSISENGEPILIEANLNNGGIETSQLSNGPIFGAETKEILDEVFNK